MPIAISKPLSLVIMLQALQGPVPGPPVARDKNQEQARHTNQDPNGPERGTDSVPPVITLSPSRIEQIIAAQKAGERQPPAPVEHGARITDWLLVLVGAGQLALFGYQFGLLKKANAAAEKSADAATRAADAAGAGVEYAKETTRLQLRAYLGRQGMGRRHEISAEQDRYVIFEFRPVIVNAGLTPARDISVRVRAEVFAHPSYVRFEFDGIEPLHVAPLGAGQTMEIVVRSGELDQAQRTRMWANEGPLYLMGLIEYRSFGQVHALEFCERVEWQDVTTAVTHPEGPHNKAD